MYNFFQSNFQVCLQCGDGPVLLPPLYLQADLKKVRNKDRETGISPFSRLSGTTPTLLLLVLEEAHVFGCRLTGPTPQAIIADS